jgi:hypothetical protein
MVQRIRKIRLISFFIHNSCFALFAVVEGTPITLFDNVLGQVEE